VRGPGMLRTMSQLLPVLLDVICIAQALLAKLPLLKPS